MKDLTIILPTLNEEGNIVRMIYDIEKIAPNANIIVADDGSKDLTQAYVKVCANKNKNIKLLDRSKEPIKGLSASAWHAIGICKTKYFIVMDADGQHPLSLIRKMYNKIPYNNYIIACREYLPKEWPLKRKIISLTASTLAKLSLFVRGKGTWRCRDPMSGMFMGNTEKAKALYYWLENYESNKGKLELTGYKIVFDILKYCGTGTPLMDMYYTDFRNRESGESKLGKRQIYSMLRAIFK